MPKLPWMQFFTNDWLGDNALQRCSPATRGIWINLVCSMHNDNQSGMIKGTLEQLARIGGCSPLEMDAAVMELENTKACDVMVGNGNVTLTNRRMYAISNARHRNKIRVNRHRCNAQCNASVMPKKSEVRSQSTTTTTQPAQTTARVSQGKLIDTGPPEDDDPPEQPKSPAVKEFNSQTVIAHWVDLHRSDGKDDPLIPGQDAAAAKWLSKNLPEQECYVVLFKYYYDKDPFLVKLGRPLKEILTRVNKYRSAK